MWRKASFPPPSTYLSGGHGFEPRDRPKFFCVKFNFSLEGMISMLKLTFLSHFHHIQLIRCYLEPSFFLLNLKASCWHLHEHIHSISQHQLMATRWRIWWLRIIHQTNLESWRRTFSLNTIKTNSSPFEVSPIFSDLSFCLEKIVAADNFFSKVSSCWEGLHHFCNSLAGGQKREKRKKLIPAPPPKKLKEKGFQITFQPNLIKLQFSEKNVPLLSSQHLSFREPDVKRVTLCTIM